MSLTTQSYDITLKVRVTVPANTEIMDKLGDDGLRELADEGAEILAEFAHNEIGAIYQEFGADLEVTEATGVPVVSE